MYLLVISFSNKGAIRTNGAGVSLNNCKFYGNSAATSGNDVYVNGGYGSNIHFVCVFSLTTLVTMFSIFV
jgi:hypothetical protein